MEAKRSKKSQKPESDEVKSMSTLRALVYSAGFLGATFGIPVAIGTYIHSIKDVTTIEQGDTIVTDGIVQGKKHVEGEHLNPLDDINPFSDLNPTKDMTRAPDEYNVTILYNDLTTTRNDEALFRSVNKGDKVSVRSRRDFEVTRDHKGNLIDRVDKGYEVISVD